MNASEQECQPVINVTGDTTTWGRDEFTLRSQNVIRLRLLLECNMGACTFKELWVIVSNVYRPGNNSALEDAVWKITCLA